MIESRDPSPAVTRALAVLGALEASGGKPQSLSDLARSVGIAKSSASNICQALEAGGMIHRVENGYRLGLRTAELGGAFVGQFNQIREFFGVVEADPLLSGHVVQIATLDGTDALYLARHEGRVDRLGTPLGSRLPLVFCAVGNAMLMAMPEAEVERLLAEETFVPKTTESVHSADAVRDKLRQARERGFALDRGGSFDGVHGIAAPLDPWRPGDPRMAIGIALPAAEATEEHVARLGEAVVAAARQLTNPFAHRPGVS
jgi:DNA-binding IclR family transcriptional regulator